MNEIITINGQSLDGTIEAATRFREAIIERGHELAEEGGAILASVLPGEGALTIKDSAAKHKEFAKRVEDLRDIGKNIVKAALEKTNAAAVIRQIDDRLMTYSSNGDAATTYAQLSALAKEIKATIDERKGAEEPQPEKFDYIVELAMTQKDFDALVKKWQKDGVEFRARRVLDNEKVRIGRIFE